MSLNIYLHTRSMTKKMALEAQTKLMIARVSLCNGLCKYTKLTCYRMTKKWSKLKKKAQEKALKKVSKIVSKEVAMKSSLKKAQKIFMMKVSNSNKAKQKAMKKASNSKDATIHS